MQGFKLSVRWSGLLLLTLLSTAAIGAPVWDQTSVMTQPDGSVAQVQLFGDEFYNWIENSDGYVLIRDPESGYLCYAEIASSGNEFQSTGVRADQPAPGGLTPKLKLDQAAVSAIASKKRAQFHPDSSKILDMNPVTSGQVAGITILIDFPNPDGLAGFDFEADVPDPADQQNWIDDVEASLNATGYSAHGNHGSVYDYFRDVSSDDLWYYNELTPHFHESTVARGALESGQQDWPSTIEAVLSQMDAEGFDFGQYDSNDDGIIDAINIYYWGARSQGNLWPHYTDNISLEYDGVRAEHYLVCNLGDYPALRVFCHESGHLLGQWPDLYDLSGEGYGLGDYCLMAYGGNGGIDDTDPVHPSAYPKMLAGWLDPIVLDRAGHGFVATAGNSTGYIIPHPNPAITSEFFLIENRQESGRDDRIDDSGLAIYHVDQNRHYQDDPNHYLVHLVQADGLWQLEEHHSFGNSTDLFSAPGYEDYDPDMDPRARWWDGDMMESVVQNVSVSGPTMTFDYPGCRQTVSIAVTPPDLGFEWNISGPGGFEYSGTANQEFIVPTCGDYTVSFEVAPFYNSPPTMTQLVGGAVSGTVEFAATYALDLEQGTPADLRDPGNSVALSVLDYDQDGDDDLFIANDGSAHRLLINSGAAGFVDATPAALAAVTEIADASWADADNDGDQDLFLASSQGQQFLFAQVGSDLTDVSSNSSDLSAIPDATSGNWGDVDNDGLLDLILTRFNDSNRLFNGAGGSPFQLLPGTLAAQAALGNATSGAHWGDINNDGWNDLLLNAPNANGYDSSRLLENNAGDFMFWSGHVNTVSEAKDAVWADFNNDGILDIAVMSGLGYARTYLIDAEGFVHISDNMGYGSTASSLTAGDFNNDGWIDLYQTRTGASDVLVVNRIESAGSMNASFRSVPLVGDDFLGANTAAVAGDFDENGTLDIYVARSDGANFLMNNQIDNGNHWLEVDLTGVACNRDALGARVTVIADGVPLIREVQSDGGPGQDTKRIHFGLGAATTVDAITIRWPGGGPLQVYPGSVSVDSRVSITQLYTLPTISAHLERDGQTLPIAGNTLLGCPLGDTGDVLVIEVDFDDASMSGTSSIQPEQILLDTEGLGYGFYDDASQDTAADASNGYTVTLRRSHIGGCGVCSDTGCNDPANGPLPLPLRFEGMPIGTLEDLAVRTVDFNGDQTVNLVDYVQLIQAFYGTSEHPESDYCQDLHPDGTVNLSDIGLFAGHYGHTFAAASSALVPVSDARLKFQAEEASGTNAISVRVQLESQSAVTAVAATLAEQVGSYRIVDWQVDASSSMIQSPSYRKNSRSKDWVVMASFDDKGSVYDMDLGTLILEPIHSSESKPLSNDDFQITFGEILTAAAEVQTLGNAAEVGTIPRQLLGMQKVYPNPFNPSVTIEYALDRSAEVTLQIHDLAGRLVTTLVSEQQSARDSNYSVVWNGRNSSGQRTSSGLYFWRLSIDGQVETGRMVMIK